MNLVWIAVADDDTCDACIERHADVKTREEWDRLGKPKCTSSRGCRCELLPYRGDPNAPLPDVGGL